MRSVLKLLIEDDHILCFICENKFHHDCANLSKTKVTLINSAATIFWSCERCLSFIPTMSKLFSKISEIEKKVDQNSENLNRQNEVLNKIQKSSELRINPNQSNNTNPVQKRRWADVIDSTPSQDNITPKRPKNISAKITTKQVHEPIVIVKNKSDIKIDLKQRVKSVLNAATDPVKFFTTTAQGKLLIHCNDQKSVHQVKQRLQHEIGKEVVVDEPKSVKPRVIILGADTDFVFPTKQKDPEIEEVMFVDAQNNLEDPEVTETPEINFNEFIKLLRKQNECLDNTDELEVVSTKKRHNGTVDVILSTDTNTFNKLIEMNKIKIGFEMCRVRENLIVLRCYKCNQYNHTAKDCKQSVSCPKCAGPHSVQECDVTNVSKCINCVKAKEDLSMNLNVNHCAWSFDCPIYQRHYNKKKSRIRYST